MSKAKTEKLKHFKRTNLKRNARDNNQVFLFKSELQLIGLKKDI